MSLNCSDSKARRILMVAPTPFFADRGCHVRILEEARALERLGFRVAICTYHLGRDIEGIETFRTIRVPWYRKLSAGPSVHKFYIDLLLLWTVIRACLRFEPAIIHAHLHEGVAIGKVASFLFGLPLVADLQGSLTGELLQHGFMKKGGFLHRIFQWAESRITALPDFILTSSAAVFDGVAMPRRMDLSPRTAIVGDGVDVETFRQIPPSTEMRERLGIAPNLKVVGFLGVLTDYQGVSVLLDAIPRVLEKSKQAHFLLMGYPNVERYRARAEDLGISDRVTFTGKVQYEEVPQHLALCDVCVSPKFGSTEANGKLLNYMAMGLPVVASDTPVNRAILGNLGVYSAVGDSVSLAGAIAGMIEDGARAAEAGKKLRQRAVDEFSWSSVGAKIAEVYSLLGRNRSDTSMQRETAK